MAENTTEKLETQVRSMLERIARELRLMTHRNGGICRDDETGRRDYVSDAKALLQAMHEPSWAMNGAVLNAADEPQHESGARVRPELVWKVMIDAAVRDEPAA